MSDQLGYSYKTIVTAPTCTEQGYTTYTCECGDSYTADFTEATGNHTFIGKTCSHCGAENPYKHYHWEIQNGELVSMHTVNQQATANAPHWMTGTITADGTMDKTQYELETAVKLEHDQPWIIEWMVLENSAWSGMLLSETATCTVTTEKYVFYNGRGRLVIGAPNVGRDIAVDTSKAHVYRLENTIVGNGNTVSLYVDGECMGVMGQGTGSMLQQNDWLNNGSTDMILKYIGAKHSSHTDFLLNNLKLGYLKIWEGGCVHSYTTTVVAPTCMQDGYTLHTCSGCGHTYKTDLVSKTDHISQSVTVVAPTCMREGYTLHLCGTCGEHYQTDPLPPVDHDFAEGNKTCITCGANNPVNPDNPASANWPVLNTDLTHIICYGQSLSVGSDAPYYADAAVDGVYMYGNLNSGTTDTTLSPLRGSTQDPIISAVKALMKMLQQDSVNQIDTDIVVGSYGMGSQTIAQLMSTDRQAQIKAEMGYTENCNNSGRYAVFANSVDALARYADRNSQTISCPAIVFLQGESDYLTQRSYSVEADKDLYKTYMKRLKEDMQQKVMAAYGQTTAPLFLIYQVSGTYVHTEDMGINMAQLEFAQENDDVILVQTPYFTSHYTTGNHLTQNGYRWLGEYIAKYMYTTLIKREQIAPPQADTITLTAENTITIHVSGVEGGLEIDTYTVEDATNGSNKYGFTVYADGVKYVPTNVTVSGSAITLECDAANGVFRKATSLSVAYAGLDAIGTGNIRDNCTDSGLYQYLDDRNDRAVSGNNSISHSSKDASGASIIGQNYPLYNWLASFRSQVTVPACEHSYTDGKCSVCGGLDAYVEFYSLSLKGNIAVNYYMYLDEAVAADPDGYMEFTTPRDGAVQIPVSQANVQTVDGQKYYVFTATVAAKEMMDTIQGQYICGESKSEIFYYSVKEYAEIILNDEAYAKVQPLVEAMLVYGAWAQKQFNYNEDNLPIEVSDLSQITADTLSKFKPLENQGTAAVSFYATSLILESETTMRLYFQCTKEPTITFRDKQLEVTKIDGGYCYVDIPNISAKNLSDTFTLTVSDGAETTNVQCCPLSYCYNILSKETDSDLLNTVRALYLYNEAANNYFK